MYASVLILINSEKNVLLLKRSKKVDSYNDFWCFPGGRVERNEEPLTAVIREAKEEINLDIQPSSLYHLYTFNRPDGKNIAFYSAREWSGSIKLNWESSEFRWVSKEGMPLDRMIPVPDFVIKYIENI